MILHLFFCTIFCKVNGLIQFSRALFQLMCRIQDVFSCPVVTKNYSDCTIIIPPVKKVGSDQVVLVQVIVLNVATFQE